MNIKLLSSPLQGFTDFRFRNAFQKYFGGIDTFYAPYIRLNGKLKIKPSFHKDVLPKNNSTINVIPQIMTNQVEEFIFVVNFVKSLGYQEINWNLGCPYPMVTNRCLGSGLISELDRIDSILDQVISKTNITISMKMRLGYDSNNEIIKAFEVLNNYPLKNVAIHARLGKQLYKGGVDLDGFERCLEVSDHTLYYNGDITSVAVFNELQTRFPSIEHWMLGRGLIADPFLPIMIKSNDVLYPEDRIQKFKLFHENLLNAFSEKLTGDKHIIMKMSSYWEYFASAFSGEPRLIKKIKKSKTLETYDEAVDNFLNNQIAMISH